MAFVRSVGALGGSFHVLDLTTVPNNTVTVTTNTGSLLIAKGIAEQPDSNGSGLVVAVVRQDSQHYWLLPGDCDYGFFPATLKSMAAKSCCVALTAFHHGAAPKRLTDAPLAVGNDYRRLVYSFGCGNSHNHPKPSAATKHAAAHWTHDATWLAAPGEALPSAGSCVRATAWTPAKRPPYQHAGGVLIGWSEAPPPPTAAVCCGSGCAAVVPTQV